MSLAIQGSFEAYVWAGLWQAALGGLQAGGPAFDVRSDRDDWISQLQHAASLMGSAVSWVAWSLSVWVGLREGIVAGVVFGVFSFAINVVTLIEIHRLNRHVLAAQIIGFFLMPAFAFKTLATLGILAP